MPIKHTHSRALLALLLGMGALLNASCSSSEAEAPSCNTPELKALNKALMEGSDQARAEALAPFEKQPPSAVPEATQRCLVESYLASSPEVARGRFQFDSLGVQVGVASFHRYHQPDYLAALMRRRPSDLLAEVYGDAVVPYLLEVEDPFSDYLRGQRWVQTAEAVLLMAEDGHLDLDASTTEALEERVREWIRRGAEPGAGDLYSKHPLRLQKRFEDELGPADVRERAARALATGSPLQQVQVLEDLIFLEAEEGKPLAEEILRREIPRALGAYLGQLILWQPGDHPKPRRPFELTDWLLRQAPWKLPSLDDLATAQAAPA
ncbi:MAG: hypothetical protein KDD47_11725 [Acidobacteria bacterium]|nr:hypothetical protein [Acidobacteriota bacterium]